MKKGERERSERKSDRETETVRDRARDRARHKVEESGMHPNSWSKGSLTRVAGRPRECKERP